MKSFVYLYKRTIINRIRKALKRPVTYVAIVFFVLYIAMIFQSLSFSMEAGNFNTIDNLVTMLSITIFWLIPGNLISYAKRKGLLFRPSEVHFVFSAPVSPKMVLMFAGVKSFAINILIGLVINSNSALLFIDLGILLFSAAVLFQIVTLPVEFNASNRAVNALEKSGMLYPEEIRQTRAVLGAAALTYVASAASAVLQLLRLIIIGGRRRND